MGKEIIAFSDIEIEKRKFHHLENPILLEDAGIKKYRCLVWCFLAKNFFFIGYKDDDFKIKQLHIIFPKISLYGKSYDSETKWMYFSFEDDESL